GGDDLARIIGKAVTDVRVEMKLDFGRTVDPRILLFEVPLAGLPVGNCALHGQAAWARTRARTGSSVRCDHLTKAIEIAIDVPYVNRKYSSVIGWVAGQTVRTIAAENR